MLVSERLMGLHDLMRIGSTYAWELSSSLSRRLIALSIISEMQVVIEQLEELNKKLELELSVEDAEIDFEAWQGFDPDIQPIFHSNAYIEDENDNLTISNMPVMLTSFKSTTVSDATTEALKSGMRQLCSEASINHSDIGASLKYGFGQISCLLREISEKMSNIPDELYENYCDYFLARDYDLTFQEAERNYRMWKEEHEWKSQQALEDKRTQEIVKLINEKSLSHKSDISNRDILNCQIQIQEEALEYGTQLPDNIDFERARFSRYVYMNGCIMLFDYAKLGRYLYKHYKEISFEEALSLKEFAITLDFIHHDMAELNPKLKPLLPDYEFSKLQAILDNAIRIINHCKPLLAPSVPEDFLSRYMEAIFIGDIKHEVQKKLGGKGVYTNICLMLGMLKASTKVFKAGTGAEQLAGCLSVLTDKPNKESMKRKIDEGSRDMKSKVRIWTDAYIKEHCYSKEERLFVEVSSKK